jgi:O-succinylbenzoic acid--CoA ligase
MTETGGFFALKEFNHLKVKDNQAYRLIDGWELGTQLEGPLEVYNAETNTLVRSTDVIQVAVGEPDDAFTWLGRSDFVINTGGVKIHPETIENYLEWLANKVVISSIPDVKLSEAVVAVVESSANQAEIQLLQDADFLAIIREKAANHSAYARPRKLFAIRAFPRVANGKVDRLALTKALQAWHKKTFPFGY